MAYERINRPEGSLFHYTKRENLEQIEQERKIRKFKDRECWFCTSLEDTLRLMEMTVMHEGGIYIDVNGLPKRYPKFEPDDYVILEVTPRYQNGDWIKWNQEMAENAPKELSELAKEFSNLKKGYRGDLKFYENPVIHEVAELLKESQHMEMTM